MIIFFPLFSKNRYLLENDVAVLSNRLWSTAVLCNLFGSCRAAFKVTRPEEVDETVSGEGKKMFSFSLAMQISKSQPLLPVFSLCSVSESCSKEMGWCQSFLDGRIESKETFMNSHM